jgi:hypothetical protein
MQSMLPLASETDPPLNVRCLGTSRLSSISAIYGN